MRLHCSKNEFFPEQGELEKIQAPKGEVPSHFLRHMKESAISSVCNSFHGSATGRISLLHHEPGKNCLNL